MFIPSRSKRLTLAIPSFAFVLSYAVIIVDDNCVGHDHANDNAMVNDALMLLRKASENLDDALWQAHGNVNDFPGQMRIIMNAWFAVNENGPM
jgi:hypothetical protein